MPCDLELMAAKAQEPHFDAVVVPRPDAFINELAMPLANGRPMAVIANQRQDHDPIMLADGLQQDASHAEHAIVVVRT